MKRKQKDCLKNCILYVVHRKAIRLNDIVMLRELPISCCISIVKTTKAFKRYGVSYIIEIIGSKYPSVQLSISKPSIGNLFKDLLNEIRALNIK